MFCSFPSAILTSCAASQKNMNAALISMKEDVYGSEDPSKQECMTWQFSGEAKRKTRKRKLGSKSPIFSDKTGWSNCWRSWIWRQTKQECGDEWWEMNTQRNSRNFWQELTAVRRHFSRGSRTGKFSGIVLLIKTPPNKGWNCTRWLLKPLL